MRYTESHEWIADDGTVGITDYAKNELGDIVFIELPKVGSKVKAGQQVCILESTKSAVDVYSPASGIVMAINADLTKHPSHIKEKGTWLFRLELSDPKEVEGHLREEEYSRVCKLHK